jgi:hypothetical protein
MGHMAPTDDRADHDPGREHGADVAGEPPVAALRGAGVEVDTRRAGLVAAWLAVGAVVVVALVLLVAGYRKNAQINELRTHGVPVQVTVTRCLALIGGTGQSPAGYECTGTYAYGGRHYTEGLPGNANLPVGSGVTGVVASGDPALLSTPSAVASSHASFGVFVLPDLLLLATAGGVVWLLVRHRRRRSA